MTVQGWQAIDDAAWVAEGPLSTGPLQRALANASAALTDRLPAAGVTFDARLPPRLHGAVTPLVWPVQVYLSPGDTEVEVTLVGLCHTADVHLWASVLTPRGWLGQHDPQTLTPGDTQVTFKVPVAGLLGHVVLGVVARSEVSASGVVVVLASEVVEVSEDWLVVDHDPGLSPGTVYRLTWTGAYPESGTPPDQLVVGSAVIPLATDWRVFVWPPTPQDILTRYSLSNPGGYLQPDVVGKMGLAFGPVGWLELLAAEVRVTSRRANLFNPQALRAGLLPSARAGRLVALTASQVWGAARWESIQPPTDPTHNGLLSPTGAPIAASLMTSGTLTEWGRTAQGSWQTLAATVVGDYDSQQDAAGTVRWKRTLTVSLLLGCLGLVEGDSVTAQVRLVLSDLDGGGTTVTLDSDAAGDVRLPLLTRFSEDGIASAARLLLWSGDPTRFYYPADWHPARGLVPWGERGGISQDTLRLARVTLQITEDAAALAMGAARLLRVQVQARNPRRGVFWLWCPVWTVTAQPDWAADFGGG